MSSEENLEEYDKSIKNECDIIQNTISKRDSHPRRVSFPENDTDLVTGYLEPVDPLRLAINVDKDELLEEYIKSCHRHNTIPLQCVVDQIKKFKIETDRTESFVLKNVELTHCGCESLEEIFKRVQFNYIDLTNCNLSSETAFALFEMFEYYESTSRLDISSNPNLGIRGWQAYSRYMKKSNTLEEFITRDINLTETEADYLTKPLTFNRHLQNLKLERCNLNGNSLRYLANALTNNMVMKELYLADNKIGIPEAILLGNLLRNNRTLQVLDLSNNQIRDDGLNHLVMGLCTPKLGGLEVLVLWNNFLTNSSSIYINNLLKGYRGLNTLNIGCNNMYDSFISEIKESLKQTQNLQRFGLQSTKLTCKSAVELADVLKTNCTLERIDLRENCILIPGLQAFSECLEYNKTLIQIDLNEIPSWNESSIDYQELVHRINDKCSSNALKLQIEVEQNRLCAPRTGSRKISLTCQTLTQEPFIASTFLTEPKKVSGKLRSPAPSPIPSPVSSPIPTNTKSRFSVSRVSESEGVLVSRFKVMTVSEPPKPVTSNNEVITIGFNYTPPLQSQQQQQQQQQQVQQQQQQTNQKQNETTIKQTPSTTHIIDDHYNVVESEKPLSNIEKLLSLFQAPTNLFSKSTNSTPDKSKDTKDNGKYDYFKQKPFSNTNLNRNTNISMVSEIANTGGYTQSIKENISPQNTITVSTNNVKKLKNDEIFSAFEVINGSSKNDVEITRAPLCSSSEDSDSGLVAFESSCSSNSVTDSGISDDSVVSYDCVPDKNNDSSQYDTDNNNRWKNSTGITESTDRND